MLIHNVESPLDTKMTDAYVTNKNENGLNNESKDTTNNGNMTDSVHEKQISLQNDKNCNISNDFNPTQNTNMNTVFVSANISLNNGSNAQTNPSDNCEENTISDTCLDKLTVTNEISKGDSVLKYVYKKDKKSEVKEKPKGHPLNSIQRKRRSINTDRKAENTEADASVKAPLIVDYETSHTPSNKQLVLPAHHRVTENTIQNSALADFNIETLHEPNQPSKSNHHQNENSSSQSEEGNNDSSENKNYSQSNSDESSESDYLKKRGNGKNNNESSESDESKEKEEYKKDKTDFSSFEDTREIEDDKETNQQIKTHKKPVDSFEIYENKKYPTQNGDKTNENQDSKSIENSESNESSENTSRDTDRATYKEQKDDSREINEKDKYRDDESSHERKSDDNSDRTKAYKNQHDSRQSRENSNENNKDNDNNEFRPPANKQLQDNDEYAKGRDTYLSTPRTVQDVDLGDFSYERIKVDDKGQIVAAGDHDENDSPVPIKPLVSPDLDQNQLTGSLLLKKEDKETDRGLFSYNHPVHINDGEVKPVVEINTEPNESESNEENSKEAKHINLEKDLSLETILGTNTNDAEEQNEKIVEQKEPEDKADIKEQFERIPLDYKHGNKQEENDKDVQSDSKEDTPHEQNEDEGTVDTFSPKDVNYDEHLKFKFDDVSIKLPEIKLPDDILAYAYEEPAYKKNKNKKQKPKPNFYQYSDEDSDETDHDQEKSPHKDNNNDNDHEYYGHRHPYDKQSLKKKGDDEEDDDNEDLYEKFVRERFGKRSSFEKRSEKLQNAKDLPYNPKLYQNVQNLLKQTAQIDKQAKTSGDPNAGYAWTLEYGENL